MVNSIHPSAIIGDDVTLGDGNTIGAFAVLTGPLTLGDGNWIGSGVVLGAPPEVRTLINPHTRSLPPQAGLSIGSNNIIREYAQVHQGWNKPTRVGNSCYLMNQVYVAHDCEISDNVNIASSALLAGHVTIGASANLGMGAIVHQGLSVGVGVMIGMGSVVVKSIPLFAKAFGNPARIRGVNSVGMERLGLSLDTIALLQKLSDTPEDQELLEEFRNCSELDPYRVT